nr:NAD(P)/FAD-dependent oxidoreductase [Sphingomonas sp. Y57]
MSASPPFDIDIDGLKRRYRQERDKRLRADGIGQYAEVAGRLAGFDEDHYAAAPASRAPLTEEVKVLIIGGGFAGLFAGAELKAAGIKDFLIAEAAADFGGTWYWNRYPGAQCDVESYIYLPMLEETGYMPKERYSYAPEIFDHARRVGRWFDLYDHAIFQTRVERLAWSDEQARWRVTTNRGDDFLAQFVICAPGFASRPKLPGITGIDRFKGKMFHSGRWDYHYTGGDHRGGLTGLADKAVAIIGTGATAIQIVPHLGASARHLYVFQRTPSSVDRRRNRPTDPNWFAGLDAGWQQERQANFDAILAGGEVEEDLIRDSWTTLFRRKRELERDCPDIARRPDFDELLDFEHMEALRARIDADVTDLHAREALKPWYRYLCKRPTFSDNYLPTFNRPNVTLVDTSESRGVEEIREDAVVACGVAYPVDCIIFATGFELNTSVERRIGFDIIGRGGTSLREHWKQGLRTLHGHSTHGFPNWFFVGQSQNAASINYTGIVREQARHIAYIINQVDQRGAQLIEASRAAEDAWGEEIRRAARVDEAFWQECTPGYYNGEGGGGPLVIGSASYAVGAAAFHQILERWRQSGTLPGMEIS